VAAGVVILSGSQGHPSAAIVPSLTLNNQNGGSFSCGGGLLFRLAASNPTNRSVHVNRFNLTLSATSAPCVSHAAPLFGEGLAAFDLPAGTADVLLRQADLKGDLCGPPNGRPEGCAWQANVVVETDIGNFGRDLQFTTTP